MDLDSLQADLNALRKLYGLLQIDGSGGQSALFLDEGSRVFLRKLLDGAAERVFEAHIKIMADNWRSLLGTNCLGQLEESKETAKSTDFDQNIKESVSALLLKDEQPLEFRMPNESPSVTAQLRRFATELQIRKKRRLACEQGSKLESVDFKSSDKESVASPKKEVEDKATKEVDNAIRRIESLIPSLHRLAKPVRASTGKKTGNPDSFRKTTLVLDLDSVGSSSGRAVEVVTRTEQTQTRQSKQADQGTEKCYKLSPRLLNPQQRNDYESLKEDDFEEEVKLLKNTASKTQLIPKTCQLDGGKSKDYRLLEEPLGRIQGKQIQRTSESYGNVGQNDNVAGQILRILPSQFNEDNVNQYQSWRTPTSRERVGMQDSVHRLNQVQYRESVFSEKHPSTRKKTGSNKNSYWPPQGNYLPRFNESEETCSDSPGSSSWSTADASSSSSPSHTTQTTTSCSGENEESGSSNYKDVDFDSSKTRSVMSQSSSSRYDPSSSNSVPDYGGGGEDDLSPSEYYQSSHHSVRHRKAGKFRRLKNKLGLIFHHHHHHHHHHRGRSDEAPGPWKRFGKMFSHVEKKAESKNPKVGDTGKKGKHLAKSAPRKQQIGHFHALVEGLMRHVKHSNKSKLGSRRGKKMNLWQNRVKVTNKARVKLQGRDKKHQLIAPKSH